MTAMTPPASTGSPTVASRLIGIALTALLAVGVFAVAGEMAADPGPVRYLGGALGLLLLVATIRNWPLLWRRGGERLRRQLGERGARVAYAIIAMAWLAPFAAYGTLVLLGVAPDRVAEAPGGHFPLGVRDTASVEVTLSHTPCFGRCPTFTVRVRGDGTVRFTGHEFVDSLAPADVRLTPAQVADILAAFERVDFRALDGLSAQRCAAVTDSPSVITTLAFDGQTKQVDHYLGCDRAPEALMQLEAAIDSIAGVARWVGNGGGEAPAGSSP